jgi:hypothetical protein
VPRYHFHVKDGKDFPDLQGTELADLDAARAEALRFTGALLGDADKGFWDGAAWAMSVTDSTGLALFQLNFFATEAPSIMGSSLSTQDPVAPFKPS